MTARTRTPRLPRLLLLASQVLAAALVALLLVAPLTKADPTRHGLGSRLLVLFGSDATLRRTTVFVAVGLAATGWIFFRATPIVLRSPLRPRKPSPPPPPPAVAGA